MKTKIVVAIITIFVSQIVFSQEEPKTTTISQARKDHAKEILNYRYKGGYYSFERAFTKNIVYPEMAKHNCIIGISIVHVTVSCEGIITNLKVINPMGYGIENAISDFFNSTEGQWNTCKEDKYTSFEISIQFVVTGTETNTTDAMLVCEESSEGTSCNNDDYYIKRIEKYKENGNNKKLLRYLSIMICRDPYNTEYTDLRNKILKGEN